MPPLVTCRGRTAMEIAGRDRERSAALPDACGTVIGHVGSMLEQLARSWENNLLPFGIFFRGRMETVAGHQ